MAENIQGCQKVPSTGGAEENFEANSHQKQFMLGCLAGGHAIKF